MMFFAQDRIKVVDASDPDLAEAGVREGFTGTVVGTLETADEKFFVVELDAAVGTMIQEVMFLENEIENLIEI